MRWDKGKICLNAKEVFKEDLKKAQEIGVEAMRIIGQVRTERAHFFWGLAPRTILAGLFYLLSLRYNYKITQRIIMERLGFARMDDSFNCHKRWLKEFPEKFPEIQLKEMPSDSLGRTMKVTVIRHKKESEV